MKHVRMATYKITKGNYDDIVRIATEPGAMSDIYEGIDGFAQFGIADVGDGDFLSMTVWDSREAAEKANEAARSWVSENVSDRIELKTSMIGDFGYLKA